jgi:cytosine/adenosine deaminase-related metal-dependent hydrolase
MLARLRKGTLSSDDALVTLSAGLSDIPIVGVDAVAHEIAVCRSLGLRMTLNCEAFRDKSGLSEFEQMDNAGLLGPDLLFVHMTLANHDQLERVRDSGGSVVVCPETTMALFHGMPSTLRAFHAGLRPALGTDITAGWSADMFSQARLALQAGRVEASTFDEAYMSKDPFRDWPTTRMMFDAITQWGAAAIGLEDQIGTLVAGKRADIVLLRADAINLAPVNDPFSTVILQSHPGNVDTVLIDGVLRKRAGRLLFDTSSLKNAMAAAHGRFLDRLEAVGGWLPSSSAAAAGNAYQAIEQSAR